MTLLLIKLFFVLDTDDVFENDTLIEDDTIEIVEDEVPTDDDYFTENDDEFSMRDSEDEFSGGSESENDFCESDISDEEFDS